MLWSVCRNFDHLSGTDTLIECAIRRGHHVLFRTDPLHHQTSSTRVRNRSFLLRSLRPGRNDTDAGSKVHRLFRVAPLWLTSPVSASEFPAAAGANEVYESRLFADGHVEVLTPVMSFWACSLLAHVLLVEDREHRRRRKGEQRGGRHESDWPDPAIRSSFSRPPTPTRQSTPLSRYAPRPKMYPFISRGLSRDRCPRRKDLLDESTDRHPCARIVICRLWKR